MATVKKTTGSKKAGTAGEASAAAGNSSTRDAAGIAPKTTGTEGSTLDGIPVDSLRGDGGDRHGHNGTSVNGDVRRRDFIHIAAVSFAGVGAAAVAIPMVTQMSASADVLALASIEVDVSAIQPGQAIKTAWRKQPVFIRNLTPAEIAEANKVDVGSLREPQTLAERTQPNKENWLITLGVCTHLGCVPLGAAAGEVKGEYGGYFCPCHGSHYDTAGRIRKGPAPTNLVVPEYAFISDSVVKIG